MTWPPLEAYCAKCRRVVSVTITQRGPLGGRDEATCDMCGRSWPTGRAK